ncbi:hypothetical protein AN220_00610 [Streptomyces nanshensis]|nr:hypothetical protein AN220_00610 [Streptomyces nanshensis]
MSYVITLFAVLALGIVATLALDAALSGTQKAVQPPAPTEVPTEPFNVATLISELSRATPAPLPRRSDNPPVMVRPYVIWGGNGRFSLEEAAYFMAAANRRRDAARGVQEAEQWANGGDILARTLDGLDRLF